MILKEARIKAEARAKFEGWQSEINGSLAGHDFLEKLEAEYSDDDDSESAPRVMSM